MDKDYRNIEENMGDNPYFTPSENVWEGIEKSINKEDKKRPIGFWFPFGSVLLLLISIILFALPINEETTHSIVKEDKHLSIDLPQKQKSTGAPKKFDLSSINASNEVVSNIKIPSSAVTAKASISEVKKLSERSKFINTNDGSAASDHNLKITNSKAEIILTDSFNNLVVPVEGDSKNRKTRVTGINELLGDSPKQIIFSSKKVAIHQPYIPTVPKITKSSSLAVGLGFVRQELLSQSKINNQISLAELIRSSDYSSNNAIQLSIAKELPNLWVVKSGIGYHQSSINTVYDLSIPYTLSQEVHDPLTSSYINTFNHTLPTISGNIETALTLRRSDQSSLSDNEKVGLELATTIVEQVIYIPLEVQKHFNFGNHRFFAFGQLGVGYHFNRSLKANNLHSDHKVVDIQDGQLELSNKFASNISSNAEIGLGYKLPIGPSTSIDLQVGINQTLFGNKARQYGNFGAHLMQKF